MYILYDTHRTVFNIATFQLGYEASEKVKDLDTPTDHVNFWTRGLSKFG